MLNICWRTIIKVTSFYQAEFWSNQSIKCWRVTIHYSWPDVLVTEVKNLGTIEMPPIYPFEIKKHHIFLRNLVRSKLQKFQINCNVFCTLISTDHELQKYCKKYLQFFCNLDWPPFRRRILCILILKQYMHGTSMVHDEVFSIQLHLSP